MNKCRFVLCLTARVRCLWHIIFWARRRFNRLFRGKHCGFLRSALSIKRLFLSGARLPLPFLAFLLLMPLLPPFGRSSGRQNPTILWGLFRQFHGASPWSSVDGWNCLFEPIFAVFKGFRPLWGHPGGFSETFSRRNFNLIVPRGTLFCFVFFFNSYLYCCRFYWFLYFWFFPFFRLPECFFSPLFSSFAVMFFFFAYF